MYNAQQFKELTDALRKCKAKYFAVSHREPFVTGRQEILQQLEGIYHQREKTVHGLLFPEVREESYRGYG